MNLLHLNAEIPLSNSFSIEASTISIAKTREERLVDDLQTFSNIEEDNLPLALAVCGANWQINDKHSLFFGIRNMNEDYFTSPVTSFFTNSSCGIYPTISANYPIANYPVAAVGVHYRYSPPLRDGSGVGLQASLYNGTGYNHFIGRDNVFRVCPKDDGIFALAQVEYNHNGSSYFLGNSLYYNNGTSFTPWFYAEQNLCCNLTMLAGYSHAFTTNAECKDFIGLGLHYQQDKFELGLFSDMARFADATEYATELSGKYNFSSHVYIQPTAHAIFTDGTFHAMVNLRLGVAF